MARFRFHKLAALAVLAAAGVWVYTGDFAFVGSATVERAGSAEHVQEDTGEIKDRRRTVAYVIPPRLFHARGIRISGQTRSDKRADLTTRADGIIEKLPVDQGDWVEEGDLILSLEVEEKTAMIETAKQLLTQRESELAATEALVRRGAMPTLRADTARSAIAAARSQLEAAEAELDRIRVVAPFTGYVDRVKVERGSPVSQGAPVATLVSIDPILAAGEISEHDVRHAKIGNAATVRLIDGTTVDGVLSYISREASAQTRTFPIEIEIENGDGRIPSGMTAEITLRAAPVSATILPRSIITLSAKGDLGVRIVDETGRVAFFPIDLVDDTGDALVLGGIPVGAKVIVAGQELVTEGDEVNAVEADRALIAKLTDEVAGGTE